MSSPGPTIMLATLIVAATISSTSASQPSEIPVVRTKASTTEGIQFASVVKQGRCPSKILSSDQCPEDLADQCQDDTECHGSGKCCSTGCAKVCVAPTKSACELTRDNSLRRGRSMGLHDNEIRLPHCNEMGVFVPVQCENGRCFCVDENTGYELPGTRARSIDLVNCTDPRPCAAHQCRMLCPFEFELDDEGCPLCQCRDLCRGIRCPGGHSCQVEEAACSQEPCPPLPTCKRPRSLSSLCPLGDPLPVSGSTRKPFLCGTDTGKPECPLKFKCHVEKGHEYGVCCADAEAVAKPGACPLHDQRSLKDSDGAEEELRCGASCLFDMQCPSSQKCCVSSICGQHCVKPSNLTACLQHHWIAQLLIEEEHDDKGYVPQCRESDGLYEERQCSRNGLVCWCVDPQGNKTPRSIGAAHEVDCTKVPRSQGRKACISDPQCSVVCEYGYVVGADGCPSCECEDPCRSIRCPENSTCVMRADPLCMEQSCSATPMCVTNDPDSSLVALYSVTSTSSEHLHPFCPYNAQPLMFEGVVVACESGDPCPTDYTCTSSSLNQNKAVCCPRRIEDTKAGQCPFVQNPPEGTCDVSNHCQHDGECLGSRKCCVVPSCDGTVCTEPLSPPSYSIEADLQGPTMCEYLRDLVELEGVSLALPTPKCDANGAYEQVQYNDLGQCWCVDELGTPIPGTKVSSRELVMCDKVREFLTCPDALCRLGCDYGFTLEKDSGCPVCECRDPCQEVDCYPDHMCQMVDIPCVDGVCPPIPQCVPVLREDALASCQTGHPYQLPGTNATLACSPRARALECPEGYQCHSPDSILEGICCPYSRNSEKSGQCPYLVPVSSGTCDLECSEDAHCTDDLKCCSNGCGTQCSKPIIMTACQHQRTLLEHRAREAGVPSSQVYMTQCDERGAFSPIQCHPATLTCWCVDTQGLELPGTRVSQPSLPDCQKPLRCPAMNCGLACLHGYELNRDGCPRCACRDPCEEVKCSQPLEECRIVHVACVGDPCPPLPVCLPKLENPCPSGSPLDVNGTLIQCGPEGTSCPSSHKCHLSPFGEYALCCPKPRSVCHQAKDPGYCEGAIKRWHFSVEENECRRFRYGGCGGNLNNFETEEECQAACPPFTDCERIREKNLKEMSKSKKQVILIPKCNKEDGSWKPHQCLEELGVCWCVMPDGKQVPGSLTRGSPQCHNSERSARKMVFNPSQPTNMICEPGQTVHVCSKLLCQNKFCLSHPNAVCRVNPCGGCKIEFVDEYHMPVNCEKGLSECQKEMQRVLNKRGPSQFNVKNVFSSSSALFVGQARKVGGDFDDLTVSGDVVEESSDMRVLHQEAANQDEYEGSPLVEMTLIDPEDFARRLDIEGVPSAGLQQDSFTKDITTGILSTISSETVILKPGTCPSLPPDLNLLNCLPTQDCSFDSDCYGDRICCFNGCGTSCVHPEEEPLKISGTSHHVPICESDGSYAKEQEGNGLSWCVDSKGNPFHETLTRGHVKCGPNGQILERMALGSVCAGNVKPMVCRNECSHAVCASHPNAICVADPCDSCKVAFYMTSGEKVECQSKCLQPLATGMCRAVFKKFYFDAVAKQCKEFIYGGCQGNDNNFGSMEECQNECLFADVCTLDVSSGTCTSREPRWYFNKDTMRCEPFVYSGCGGNRNNFRTKKQCDARCPDLVLCPYWSASVMEPRPCSRMAACLNESCFGYPEAICNIDPCSCNPYFTDERDQILDCKIPTESPKTRLAFSFEEESTDESGPPAGPKEVQDSASPSTDPKGSREGQYKVFLEGEPSLTRCQLLQEHLRERNSRRYIPQCDRKGNFLPTQCYSQSDEEGGTGEEVKCWCVDETGRKTEPALYFDRGRKQCEFVEIQSVVVTLGFRGQDIGVKQLGKVKANDIRKQIKQLLKKMAAETLEKDIGVVDLPDITQVKFTLLGSNKIDIAYHLEEKVRNGELVLQMNKEVIPADFRASWFHHQQADSSWPLESQFAVRANEPSKFQGGAREVLSEAVIMEPPYLATTVVFTVLSAMLLCGLIVAVVLYRRHTTGQYPKGPRGSMQSLAFSDTSLDRKSTSSRLSERIPSSSRHSMSVTTVENEYRNP